MSMKTNFMLAIRMDEVVWFPLVSTTNTMWHHIHDSGKVGVNLSSSYHVTLGLYSIGTMYDRPRLVDNKVRQNRDIVLKKVCTT